jgi:hypothetical protein
MARDSSRLPLTVVGGGVILTGAFSPSRIDYEVKRQLAARWGEGPGARRLLRERPRAEVR